MYTVGTLSLFSLPQAQTAGCPLHYEQVNEWMNTNAHSSSTTAGPRQTKRKTNSLLGKAWWFKEDGFYPMANCRAIGTVTRGAG